MTGNDYAGGQRYQTANTATISADAPVSANFAGSAANEDLIFRLGMTAIPEPASLILLSLGSTLMLARRRR